VFFLNTVYMLSPVHQSVTRVDDTKAVEVKIVEFLPHGSPIL